MYVISQIDLYDVQGTGKDGRILKEDLLQYLEIRKSGKKPPTPSAPARPVVTMTPGKVLHWYLLGS